MMAEKARLFGDSEARDRILAAGSPAAAKKLGRGVRGFHEQKWARARFDIVVAGSRAKFGFEPDAGALRRRRPGRDERDPAAACPHPRALSRPIAGEGDHLSGGRRGLRRRIAASASRQSRPARPSMDAASAQPQPNDWSGGPDVTAASRPPSVPASVPPSFPGTGGPTATSALRLPIRRGAARPVCSQIAISFVPRSSVVLARASSSTNSRIVDW